MHVLEVLEKVLGDSLYNFLNERNLLAKLRSGFRHLHSTSTALIELYDELLENMNNGKLTGAIMIDLRKAFDTIDHELLLTKLRAYGIKGLALKWFKSYLYNRRQCVMIGSTLSEYLPITIGIPQGSIIGPLLFLIFINDLPDVLSHSRAHLYADDTSVVASDKCIQNLALKLNTDMSNLYRWLCANRLILNVPKCNSIIFGTSQRLNKIDKTNYSIEINGQPIAQVSETKLLGVILDSTLSFQPHVNQLCKKISRKLGLLKYLKSFIPTKYVNMLYNAIVKPNFDYCDIVWGNCSKSTFEKVFRIQKRASRILTGAPYCAHSEPLFKQLRWNSLMRNIEFHKCVLIFKALNNLTPAYIRDKLVYTSEVASRSTRSTSKCHLYIPKPKITAYRHSFSYSGPHLWNLLPENVRLAPSLATFKSRYWKHVNG